MTFLQQGLDFRLMQNDHSNNHCDENRPRAALSGKCHSTKYPSFRPQKEWHFQNKAGQKKETRGYSMRYSALILAAGLMAAPFTQAAPVPAPEKKAPATAAAESKELKDIRERMEKRLKAMDPTIAIDRVEKTDWPSVYMVVLKGGQIIYANKDSNLLLQGNMLKLEEGRVTNLTEEIRGKEVAKQLKEVKDKDMIVFSPKGEVKGVVYAFTDVDCGYCRKLHQEVPAMNAMGIEMRYLAFPRGGKQSPAYTKMSEAWCSAERKQSMTELKTGKPITAKITKDAKGQPDASCAHLVDDQYQLGLSLGVNGTPAIYLADGRAIPGYRPANELARLMDIKPEPAKN